MKIKIHRGLDQIGGCITEIWTDSSRVFIDFGQNLPGNGKTATPEEDTLMLLILLGTMRKSIKRFSIRMLTKTMLDCSVISCLNSILEKEVKNFCLLNIGHFLRDTRWQ